MLQFQSFSDFKLSTLAFSTLHFFATCSNKSTTLLEYPYSLSYQAINLTNVGDNNIPAFWSKIVEYVEPRKSDETTESSV